MLSAKLRKHLVCWQSLCQYNPLLLNLPDHGNKKLPQGNFTQEMFESLVEKTKNYIRKGDIIQAVLSQRFSIPYLGQPIDLYRAIRAINPSPYMFIMETEDYSIVGASPEVHVRLNGEDVMIRPIAGTRPWKLRRKRQRVRKRAS